MKRLTISPERRSCRRAAKVLGCNIDGESYGYAGRYYNYWVTGPRSAYGCDDPDADPDIAGAGRHDPFTGDHVAADWGEVAERLRGYETDLYLFARGFDYAVTLAIEAIFHGGGEAACLARAWLGQADVIDEAAALALADLLDERGIRAGLGDTIRLAVNRSAAAGTRQLISPNTSTP